MSIESRLSQLETDVNNLASTSQDILTAIETKTGEDISYIFPLRTSKGISRGATTGGKRQRSYADEVTNTNLTAKVNTLSTQMANIDQVIANEILQNPAGIGQSIIDAIDNSLTQLTDYYTQGGVNTQISNAVQASTSTLQTQITNEISSRVSGDNTLTTNLNNEITNRSNADITINANIQTLSNNLSTEINDRELAIDAEVLSRTNADTNLQNQINTINTDLTSNNGANQLLRLDINGDLPSGLVQSSVQEVSEYANATDMNNEPNKTTNKLYITTDNNKIFRWSGTSFIELTTTQSVVSVNTKSGSVILNPDDLDDTLTLHKFVTADQINDINTIDSLASQITNNTNSLSSVNTNITNIQNELITKITQPSLTNNAGKVLKVNNTATGVLWGLETVSADELPPYTLTDAQKVLAVNLLGTAVEWVDPSSGTEGTEEYVPIHFIRPTTNNSHYSNTLDQPTQILTNGIQNLYYEGRYFDNNANHYFQTNNTATKEYISFQMQNNNQITDQGCVIYLINTGFQDDASTWGSVNSIAFLTLQGAGFGQQPNTQLFTNGAVNSTSAWATVDGTWDSQVNSVTNGSYRLPANYFLTVSVDNQTKTMTFYIHNPSKIQLRTHSFSFNGTNVDNKTRLYVGVKLIHNPVDNSDALTQKFKVCKATDAPIIGGGVEYIYPSGTPAGTITLPISQNDVVGLVSALNSKITAPTPLLSNQFLKVNSGATGFEYGVPSGSLPIIDNTTNGKYLYNNGISSSWQLISIPTSLPLLNLPANSVPNPASDYYVGSDSNNYVWRLKDTANLTNYLTISQANTDYYTKNYINSNYYTQSGTNTQISNALNAYSPLPNTLNQAGNYLKFDGSNVIWSPALSAYLDVLPFGTSTTDNRIRHISGSDILLYNHSLSLVKIPKKLSLDNNQLENVSKLKLSNLGQIVSNDDSPNFTITDSLTQLEKDIQCNRKNVSNASAVQGTHLYADNLYSFDGSQSTTFNILKNRIDGNFAGINLSTGNINLNNNSLSGVVQINGSALSNYLNTNNFSGQIIYAQSVEATNIVQCNQLNTTNITILGSLNGVLLPNQTQLNNLFYHNIIYDYQIEITAISPAILGSDPCVMDFTLPVGINVSKIRSTEVWVEINDSNLQEGNIWKKCENYDGVYTLFLNDNTNTMRVKFYNSNKYGNHACKIKILYSKI
jgi:hypothetical protein